MAWTDEDGHDCLDPALLRSARSGRRIFLWLPALHVNKQSWSLQMSVSGEINVVDPRSLEGGCLLSAHVRRKQEDPVARLTGGKCRPATVQLFDYDPNVLVAKVPLLLDEVPNRSPCGLPGDDAVEQGSSRSGRANLGLRHPPLESGPVHVHEGLGGWSSHVQKYSTFIINEQGFCMNTREPFKGSLTRRQRRAGEGTGGLRCRKLAPRVGSRRKLF